MQKGRIQNRLGLWSDCWRPPLFVKHGTRTQKLSALIAFQGRCALSCCLVQTRKQAREGHKGWKENEPEPLDML